MQLYDKTQSKQVVFLKNLQLLDGDGDKEVTCIT